MRGSRSYHASDRGVAGLIESKRSSRWVLERVWWQWQLEPLVGLCYRWQDANLQNPHSVTNGRPDTEPDSSTNTVADSEPDSGTNTRTHCPSNCVSDS